MEYLKKAHLDTDIILEKLENRITNDYDAANEQVNRLFLRLLKKFERIFDKKLKELENGKITKKEYRDFMVQNVLLSREWKRINKEIANFYAELNQKSLTKINDKIPEIYEINYNAVQKAVEKEVT